MATTKNGILMSLGTVNMWGFSPAYDAQDVHQSIMKVEKESSSSNQDQEEETLEKDPLNILLACAGDIRHVLQTIAFRRRHASSNNKKKLRPLHLYVYEKSIEPLCRLFLFLEIIQDWELSLRTRCNLFLEIYGNSLVQERTSKYIEDKAKALIDFFHYENKSRLSALNTSGLLMDLSHLKMKARDEMVDNFKGWFQHNPFDIEKLRDHRLRHYYEVRYDHRNNLIDWDYTVSFFFFFFFFCIDPL
jgi:dynein assembly factor 3